VSDSSFVVTPDFSEVIPVIERENIKEMLTVTREGTVTTVRINSSSLSLILSCPRKSYYVLHRKLRSISESPALIFGSAIHKALEVFYSHPYAKRDIPAKFKEYSDMMAFGKPAPEPEHFLYKAISAFVEAAQPLAALPDTDKRSITNGIWILQEYFKTYIHDPYEVYCDANGPVTERTGELLIHDDGALRIILFGTIDVVLKNLADQRVLPSDHKTTSQVGHDFFNRLKPNHQYTGYVLLTQKVLGLTATEFLVNALQVKSRPVTARGSGPHFTRQVTTRSDFDIEEFKDSVLEAVNNYLRWEATGKWPLGTVDACAQWGGCSFLQVCSSPEQLREHLISAKFTDGKQPK